MFTKEPISSKEKQRIVKIKGLGKIGWTSVEEIRRVHVNNSPRGASPTNYLRQEDDKIIHREIDELDSFGESFGEVIKLGTKGMTTEEVREQFKVNDYINQHKKKGKE